MSLFLNKKRFFICFILLFASLICANELKGFFSYEGGYFEEFRCKSIFEIKEKYGVGKIIDVYVPSPLLPCYVFVFKRDDKIYEIVANTDNSKSFRLENMDLSKFFAIGYFSVRRTDGEVLQEMFSNPNVEKYNFLNEIDPNTYISISKIEAKLGLKRLKIEHGASITSPFDVFYYSDGDYFLEIVVTPKNDKGIQYYIGKWSYDSVVSHTEDVKDFLSYKDGYYKKFRNNSIFEIKEKYAVGEIIDVYFPSLLLDCYVFVFKKDNIIYEITANRNGLLKWCRHEDMDLSTFYSTGYFSVRRTDGEVLEEMFPKANVEKYNFLNEIDPKTYVSMSEIEEKLGLERLKIEPGTTMTFPFDVFFYLVDGHVLQILATPKNDKGVQYYMGGWAYSDPY